MNAGSNKTHRQPSPALRDALLIGAVAVAAFLLAWAFELFEAFERWSLQHEGLEIDEIFASLVILAPAFALFSLRRWLELRRELSARRSTDEERARFAALIQNSSDFIGIASLQGDVLFINSAGQKLVGIESDEEALATRIPDYVVNDDVEEVLAAIFRDGRWEGELLFKHFRSGEVIPVYANGFTVRDDRSGEPVALATLSRDLRESRRTEEELEAITHTISDVLYKLDSAANLVWWNKSLETVVGLAPEELAGKPGLSFFVEEDIPHVATAIAEAFQKGQAEAEGRIITPNGPVPYHFRGTVLRDESGNVVGLTGIGRDISERKRAEETIRHLAYHDALTGLPNRALFEDRLKLALAQAHRGGQLLAVLFLDLDHFKLINDTLGHAVGDQLLNSLASGLSHLLREGDTAARVGGDEFIVLLPVIGRVEDAVEVSERVLSKLAEPRVVAGHELQLTTSVGVAIYPHDGADAETLLSNADIAMYRAKEEGRNRIQLFTPDMNASVGRRLALENGLRRAVEREELLLHYQPLASVRTGRIIAAEALLRWQHPERGLLMPADFINVAEETGLIVPIGEWVLRAACAQARAWQKAGVPGLRIAVNLSARQFLQPGLLDAVTRALSESRLRPDRLELEITESIAMQNAGLTVRMLSALQDMGVRVSIDDFGTGYSSLSYLKNFRIHALKVDGSFVEGLPADANDAAIVAATVAMAHSLNLVVIAEGVESDSQLDFLRAQGCDEFQGYLLSRPLSADAFQERFANGKAHHRRAETQSVS